MLSRAAAVIAVSFLAVALICSLTSASHLIAISQPSQPSQGGGYPNYEDTSGATPDCLVTPKKYVNEGAIYGPKYGNIYATYSELQCCKTSYSGPNLQAQTTRCENYYDWKDKWKNYYNILEDRVFSWGLLPPYHVYLKSVNNGAETISQPPVNTTGPGECMQGCGCIGCLAPGGNATNPGNNTLPTFPITKVHNPASPRVFGSAGNATNPANNTGMLPPGSIFKVLPGTALGNNIGNATNPGNNTGTPPAQTITKEHNPASPNLFSLAPNATNPGNNTNPGNSTNSSAVKLSPLTPTQPSQPIQPGCGPSTDNSTCG